MSVQLREAKRAVQLLTSAMIHWNKVAAAAYEDGRTSDADEVLAALWERRKLRMNKLKWIQSWLLEHELAGARESPEDGTEKDARR